MTEELKTEEQTLAQKNIERMDRICETLLDLIEKEDTPDKLKPVLFTQCMNWQKMRDKIQPQGSGNRLQEMSEDVKGHKGNRSAGAKNGKRGPYRSKDGTAIRKIIQQLPSFGRDKEGAVGDQEDTERQSGGVDSPVDVIHSDNNGHDHGDLDGNGDGAVI